MEAGGGHKLREAFDPRVRIYRDRWNEYFVFLLSAAGASIVGPLLMLIAGAVTDDFGVEILVAGNVAITLFLIFGIGRPQMRPVERLGWMALWGGTAVVFGLAFYYMVFDRVL